MTKWRQLPHWTFSGTYLGSDQHGDWIGLPTGTHYERPGAAYDSPSASVTLVPAPDADERGWLAAFHAAGHRLPGFTAAIEVYVDITTPPKWQGRVLTSVDLDLDVVRGSSGRVWVDDEDEFAEHRHTLDYPDVVVAHAGINCDLVQQLVSDRVAPFDGRTHLPWLAQVS
ncbi:DUF402 domain-containing protein [Nocardioides alcanivorans]|uniref:DUF402 domain-containing protein n=1 Tax=Nocardioides alcanivorans TaxID=2897352 RepID=UPI001F4487B4|nr:DUF402 domain-containing protein [Nocardioides alcanivorans]